MCTHGLASFFGIAMLHGFQNFLVMNLTALGAAGHAEDAEALLAEKADDGIEKRKNDGIVGAFGQGQMKIEVGFDVSLGVLAGAIHDGDRLAHSGQLSVLNTESGQRRDPGLENRASFRQMSRAFRLADFDHEVERLPDGLSGAIGDESSTTGKSFDQAFFAKSLDGLAHGGAADPEALREFAFGGELIARLQSAFDDGFLDLLNDLLVETGGTNEFVHCTAPCNVRRKAGGAGTDGGRTTIPHIQRGGAGWMVREHGSGI